MTEWTSIRVSKETRDKINELCKTKLGKVSPEDIIRHLIGLDN